MTLPQEHGAKILARQAGQVAATAAAGFERLAAIVAFADHLHLRGRGEHVERAFAHHRVEQLPAFVGRELEQRLVDRDEGDVGRSEEHTSELQSLMRITYAVFCWDKTTNTHLRKSRILAH